jgi:hypothetical protein
MGERKVADQLAATDHLAASPGSAADRGVLVRQQKLDVVM